ARRRAALRLRPCARRLREVDRGRRRRSRLRDDDSVGSHARGGSLDGRRVARRVLDPRHRGPRLAHAARRSGRARPMTPYTGRGASSPLRTDLYQLAMLQSYFDGGMRGEAVFELFVRRLPPTRTFLVAAGLEQLVEYLTTLRFDAVDLEQLAATGLFADKFLAAPEPPRFPGD